ncbi:MAG: hypothetical protein FE78DRAFT_103627 [Acidomyces sp. 'richmondensis']|nr:MAG: hypothetical protein FE78DRAFT_103627 [Acidomyces sp. 'richmondensis']
MSIKANLKAAKAALDAEDFAKAVVEAQIVLSSEPHNYFACLFLGRALEKQGKLEDAEKSYVAAAKSKPEESQAWLGLCSVYERQGGKRVDEYHYAAVKAAEIFAKAEDRHRCQTTIDKFVAFAKQHGAVEQYKRALTILLPDSPVYACLEGRIPHPSHTYIKLAEITEELEAQQIKQEISERRTRIGARIGQVTVDVKREVLGKSELEVIYQHIIDWSKDDDVRRKYEEKLLQHAYDVLLVLPAEHKSAKLDQVLNLAEGMVIIHHPFRLAWDLVLETRDLDNMGDMDLTVVDEYIQLFPDSGLAKVLKAWINSELSPYFDSRESAGSRGAEEKMNTDPQDRLLLLSEGLSASENSALAHRLCAEYYLHFEEYETAMDTARLGLKIVSAMAQQLGMTMQNTKDALNSALATALVHYQAPRHHPEAKRLFENILNRKEQSTPALIGLGLIFEETEDYQSAIDFFTRALQQNPHDIRIGTERAWCRALCGQYDQAQQELENYLSILRADGSSSRQLISQVLYRIGVCIWRSDTSRTARRSRDGAYSRFLSAIKTNVNLAPAYTSLGYYYEDYAKDKKRARQCFQKAFELSAAETEAAERLAKSFADQGDWEIVEVVAQRVIDSGRARPPPGSKRKGISWPYSAIGVVQMNRQEYHQAITSFLAALRISPDDYQSYVGLGESYHNSGRYNSALRTLSFALHPPEGVHMNTTGETWFAQYMLANVHRELGDFDEAIEGLGTVLQQRPREFGVMISLLQTFVEKAWRCLENGLYGQATHSATRAISIAGQIAEGHPQAFNMWKGVGEACLIFSWVQSGAVNFPESQMQRLLCGSADEAFYSTLEEIDQVRLETVYKQEVNGEMQMTNLSTPLASGILAFKRAISACSTDIHAQAVAWYNLGCAEYRAFLCNDMRQGKIYLKAAVRAFKRAIELEAGNAEFWNALGVVTTTFNPKVAQHSLVRSLHLNELNAKVWANLGVMYLLQNDYELSHQAFSRAQSTDPTYAHAWVGEGIIALLTGETREALNHFTHAFEISESSSTITKKQYALSTFDYCLASAYASNDLSRLIQPLFALEQLRVQSPTDLPYQHLAALFMERMGKRVSAIETLTELCTSAEMDYEASESIAALARFAHAKADLARCQLAESAFEAAFENAETALDLSSDPESSGLREDLRHKLRLSAHLTAGLAAHNLKKSEDAVRMFRSALEESDSNPDVVCLLAKVLWERGGEAEKSVSREQLFEVVEKHPEHSRSITLLGTIAALDGDYDTSRAVIDDLIGLRTKPGLHAEEIVEIEDLLAALSGLDGGEEQEIVEIQSSILLRPDDPAAWSKLASMSCEGYAASMALKTAQKAVPPAGEMGVSSLAKAAAGVGTAGDAQRAIALTPWEQ